MGVEEGEMARTGEPWVAFMVLPGAPGDLGLALPVKHRGFLPS